MLNLYLQVQPPGAPLRCYSALARCYLLTMRILSALSLLYLQRANALLLTRRYAFAIGPIRAP